MATWPCLNGASQATGQPIWPRGYVVVFWVRIAVSVQKTLEVPQSGQLLLEQPTPTSRYPNLSPERGRKQNLLFSRRLSAEHPVQSVGGLTALKKYVGMRSTEVTQLSKSLIGVSHWSGPRPDHCELLVINAP